jgi:preprotein translocase subunit SecA
MAFKINTNFIDSFKVGDNINYNLQILKILYNVYENSSENDRLLLIKPIVIFNTSITEAVLYDFVEYRIRRANLTEKLFEEIAKALSGKYLDKFEHYIIQAEKYDFFKMKDTNFYNAMHSLRKVRNRIHIQNSKHIEPKDEYKIFNEKAKVLSEKVLEKTLLTLSTDYPRREEYHKYVEDFELPWNRHF